MDDCEEATEPLGSNTWEKQNAELEFFSFFCALKIYLASRNLAGMIILASEMSKLDK